MKGDVRMLSQHACGSSPSDGDCHPFFLFLSVTALYRKHSVKPNAAYLVESRNLDATENDSFKPDSGFIQMKKEHFGSSTRDASFMLTFLQNRSVVQSTQTDCDSGKRQVHRELCISAVRGPSGDHNSRGRRKHRCPGVCQLYGAADDHGGTGFLCFG